MGLGERLKKTFSRRSSTSTGPNSSTSSTSTNNDPADKTSAVWYQPGEKIPYKYRRPVEPAHKAKLESFSFSPPWKRKNSAQSQYSPHGSRMPSRSGPSIRGKDSMDGGPGVRDGVVGSHLEPIQSVRTGSDEDIVDASGADVARSGFTVEELREAMKHVEAS